MEVSTHSTPPVLGLTVWNPEMEAAARATILRGGSVSKAVSIAAKAAGFKLGAVRLLRREALEQQTGTIMGNLATQGFIVRSMSEEKINNAGDKSFTMRVVKLAPTAADALKVRVRELEELLKLGDAKTPVVKK